MKRLKAALTTAAFLGAVATGALGATAASADVACNRWGECWHVNDRYTGYPANLGIVLHGEAWRAAHAGGRWRRRADRSDNHGHYSHGRQRPS